MSKVSLKDVSILITKGTTPSSVGCEFVSEGINFIKSESIADSKYLNNQIYEHINIETDNKLKRSRIKLGDLLFSIAGAYLGKIAIVQENDIPANTNQAVGIVRLDSNKVDIEYVYYYFSQSSVNNYINNLSSQSSQPNLNLDLLGKLEFEYREIEIQKKIAAVLSSLDSKIELNNRINAELEQMAKTIYDYWFVQFDFPISPEYAATLGQPELEGKPYKSSGGKMVWSDELKREVPDGWEVKSLGEYLDCNKNTIKSLDKLEYINYLDTSNLTENKIDLIQRFDIQDDKIPSRAQRYVKSNDILFSTVRPNQHHFGIFKNPKHNLIASTGFAVLTHKSDPTLNDMFYMAITNKTSLKKLESIANSSVSAYPSINYSDILNLTIALPKNKDLIHVASKYVSNLFLQISQKQTENETLSTLRDWLLPMLMNGQVRVGDVEDDGAVGMAAEPVGEYKVRGK